MPYVRVYIVRHPFLEPHLRSASASITLIAACVVPLHVCCAEYVQERNVREPMVMANVTAASDGVIRARNAQHTLRENKAAGSRTATDSTLGAMAQLGAGEAGKIDKIGLTGGVRFLADGIRPSDLDIDEIIAPEMREMVSCSCPPLQHLAC